MTSFLFEVDGTNEQERPEGPPRFDGDWCESEAGRSIDPKVDLPAWRCTREVGHAGPHAAHGTDAVRPLATWED